MKKSLLALLVLSAASGYALAESSVTLYGNIDAGGTVAHQKGKTKVQMSNGNWGSNSVGIRGSEDIGGRNQVNFRLEQGFKLSNGAIANGPSGGAFNRQATIGMSGRWGEFAMGRFGGLTSDTGTYSILGGSAYGTNFQSIGSLAGAFILSDRVNNGLIYVSPEGAGFQGYAVYSNGVSSDSEKWSKNTHYYGLGGTYAKGPFKSNASWEMYDYRSPNKDSANIFTWGASYDFPAFTLYGAYQYAMNSQYLPDGISIAPDKDNDNPGYRDANSTSKKGANQNAFSLSASTPLWKGTAYLQGQYAFGKIKGGDVLTNSDKYNVWSVGAAYTYPLSKRTILYGQAAYGESGKALKQRDELKGWNTTVGMSHSF
jgi:predicted porin